MPILNFPNSPGQGQLYVDSDRAWVFTGSVWTNLGSRTSEYWITGGSIDAGSATNNSATMVLSQVLSPQDARQSGRYRQSVTFSTAGTYSLTVPPGVNYCTVEVWGGGGSGGGASTNTSLPGGNGGGAGGFASLIIRGVRPGTVFSNFTVGANGTQVAINTNGNAGGSSSFTYNGVTLTATGGAGGVAAGGGGGSSGGTGSMNIGTLIPDATSSTGTSGTTGSFDSCAGAQIGGTGGAAYNINGTGYGGGGTGGGVASPGVTTGAAGTAGAIRFTFDYNLYYSLG